MSASSLSAFAHIIAPLLLGSMLSYPLYGVAVAQGISYYCKYPHDPKLVKYSVALLLVVDSAHTFSLANGALAWYLQAGLNPQYPLGMIVNTFLSYVSTAFVQSAFTLRVWILYKRGWLVPSVILFFVLCQLAGGLGLAAEMIVSGGFSGIFDAHSKILGSLELVSAIICDTMISSTLVYILRKHSSGVRGTKSLVDKLIIYFVGIGTLSSVFALLIMIMWWEIPHTFIWVTFHCIISKFYVNSLLVTLNSRQQFRHNLANGTGVDTTRNDGAIVMSTFVAVG